MVFACGLLARNGFCSMEVRLVVRKFCMMGPQSPCGSSTNVSRIVFALRRSPMIWSPGIVLADGVLVSTSILSREYFSRSLFWRFLSAMAVNFC